MYGNPYYIPFYNSEDNLTTQSSLNTPDTLEHYGVLGMKWGIRHYQNADGTLTEAGKKRRDKQIDRYNRLDEKSKNSLTKGVTARDKAANSRRSYIRYEWTLRTSPNLSKKEARWLRDMSKNSQVIEKYFAKKSNTKLSKAYDYAQKALELMESIEREYGAETVDALDSRFVSAGKEYFDSWKYRKD